MTAAADTGRATSSTAALVGVTTAFGGRRVLDDVTFSFAPATRYVVRGPSGAGKSTLLNVLAGYVVPDAGRVLPAGSTGYLLQDEMLFSAMSVRDNLRVRAAGAGLDEAWAEQRLVECLASTNVGHLADATVAQLSGGERQRVQLAGQLLCSVDLLLLDEPTSRLDPRNTRDVVDVVTGAFGDRTVVVVTHDDASPFLEDAVVVELSRGRLSVV